MFESVFHIKIIILGSTEFQSNNQKNKNDSPNNIVEYRFRRYSRNNNQNLKILNHQNVKSSSKTSLIEARIIMSCHNVLYEMMTNQVTLINYLSLYNYVLEKIEKDFSHCRGSLVGREADQVKLIV